MSTIETILSNSAQKSELSDVTYPMIGYCLEPQNYDIIRQSYDGTLLLLVLCQATWPDFVEGFKAQNLTN